MKTIFSDRILLDIAAKTSSPLKRMAQGSPGPGAGERPGGDGRKRLELWCEHCARGDWDLFKQRLAWDQMNPDTIERALASPAGVEQVPPWLRDFGEMLAAIARKGSQTYPFLLAGEPAPFAEMLAPLVAEAGAMLAGRHGDRCRILSREALAGLERHLLDSLSAICLHTFLQEFYLFRQTAEDEAGAPFFPGLNGKPKKEIYREFCRWENFCQLLTEYPVLMRLLDQAIRNWLVSSGEFLARAAQDLEQIAGVFGGGDPGRIAKIACGLSDPHNGGRTTAVLSFESGLKLVYKPKEVRLEKIFFGFLSWLNTQNPSFSFKVLQIMEGKGYGWVEYVEHLPCRSEGEVRDFYRRAGQLLAVFYLLGATDCHYENFIASGAQPVLIDMETILSARFHYLDEAAGPEGESEGGASHDLIFYSVLNSLMLPTWKIRKHKSYDIGGLTGPSDRDDPVSRKAVRDINTDDMRMERRIPALRDPVNRPLLEGRSITPERYTPELSDGFTAMYLFLLQNRPALRQPQSPLEQFRGARVRVLCRDTSIYYKIREKSLAPEYLKDGADRFIALEVLSRAFMNPVGKPVIWPVLAEERRAIAQLDIPYFYASSAGTLLLPGPEGELKHCLRKDFMEEVYLRLDRLSAIDLSRQAELIKAAILCWSAGVVDLSGTVYEKACYPAAPVLEKPRLTGLAERIGEEIAQKSIPHQDEPTWLASNYLFIPKRYQPFCLRHDLFGGKSGIALFWAALGKITGKSRYARLAEAAIQSLRRLLAGFSPRLSSQHPEIAGATIYALVRAGQFLDDELFIETAGRLREALSRRPDREGNDFSVITGLSGDVLGLLSLYQVSGDRRILDLLQGMGRKLLQYRPANLRAYKLWYGKGALFLPGFAQGVSGQAFTLIKLWGVLNQPDLLEAARELIALEEAALAGGDRETPSPDDLREGPADKRGACSWSGGLMGMGMAALALVKQTPGEADKIRAEKLAEKIAGLPLDENDTLYAGNFGRVDFLLTAAAVLQRPDMADRAGRLAAQAVSRRRKRGLWALYPGFSEQLYHPGLFTGTAGIGYQLLRNAYPAQVPSVLFFE